MKIWTNNATATWQGNHKYSVKLREGPDYIFVDGFAHDKNTLSPIFATNHHFSSYHDSSCRLENNVMIPHYSTDFSLGVQSSTSYYAPFNINSHVANRGQANLVGINFKETWPSAYDEKIEYVWEANGHYGRCLGVDKTKNYRRVKFLYKRGADWHHSKGFFFHEDENYIYAFTASYNTNNNSKYYHHINRIAKDGSGLNSCHYINTRSHDYTFIYKDDEYFVYSQSVWNFNSSRPAFGIRKTRYDDQGWGATSTWNSYRDDHDALAYKSLLRQYIQGDSGYETGTGMIYQSMPMSDGTSVSFGSGAYYSSSPALVHDHDESLGLRVNNNVARMYYATFNENFFLQILRVNLPIKDHTLAKDVDAPIFDIRKCDLSTQGLFTENIHIDDMVKTGTRQAPTDIYGHGFINLAYFYDELGQDKRHFLIFTTDQVDGLGHYSQYDGGTRAFVFQIIDFNDSLVDDLHETDSLNLNLVQVIDVTTSRCYQTFRPDYDPKKWIAFENGGTNHKIYTWNPTLKNFQTSTSIKGRLTGIATDTTGRLYTIHNNHDHNVEIHVETLDYPSKIVIEPEDTNLDFISSPINTNVKISAYNYEGTQIDLNNVTLKINGKNAKFDNNDITKTINLSKNSISTETITISGPTELDLTATIN